MLQGEEDVVRGGTGWIRGVVTDGSDEEIEEGEEGGGEGLREVSGGGGGGEGEAVDVVCEGEGGEGEGFVWGWGKNISILGR